MHKEGQSPVVLVNSPNVFNGSALNATFVGAERYVIYYNFSIFFFFLMCSNLLCSIFDFKNLGPAELLDILRQLFEFLEQYRKSPVFDTKIPFSGKDLGDLFDFIQGFEERLSNVLYVPIPPAERSSPSLSIPIRSYSDVGGMPNWIGARKFDIEVDGVRKVRICLFFFRLFEF